MTQTDITSFVSCWYCRDNYKYGYEYCLKCDHKTERTHEWYPITIERIKCKRCWYCGKTIKIEVGENE